MYRGWLNWLLGTPKGFGVDISIPGWLEKKESPPLPRTSGWLNALTNCTSKRVEKRSVMRVVLASAKSTFQRHGPRMAPKPNVLSAKVAYRNLATTVSGFGNAFGTPFVLFAPYPDEDRVGLLFRVSVTTPPFMGISPWLLPFAAWEPNSVPHAEES